MPSSMRYQLPVAGSIRRPEITASPITSIASNSRRAPLTGALRCSMVLILIDQDLPKRKKLHQHSPRVQGRDGRLSACPLNRVNRNGAETTVPLPQAIGYFSVNKPSIRMKRKVLQQRSMIKFERCVWRICGLAQEQGTKQRV